MRTWCRPRCPVPITPMRRPGEGSPSRPPVSVLLAAEPGARTAVRAPGSAATAGSAAARRRADDPALGAVDEVGEVGHLRIVAVLAAQARHRLAEVDTGARQQPHGRVEPLDGLRRVPLALETDAVEPVAGGLDADGLDEGQCVLRDHRVAADVGVAADAAELVDGG